MYRRIYNVVMPLLQALATYSRGIVISKVKGSLDVSLARAVDAVDASLVHLDYRPDSGVMHPAPPRCKGIVIGTAGNLTNGSKRYGRVEMRPSVRTCTGVGWTKMPRRRLQNKALIAQMPNPVSCKSSKALARERWRVLAELRMRSSADYHQYSTSGFTQYAGV
jgi:hypothetical protein